LAAATSKILVEHLSPATSGHVFSMLKPSSLHNKTHH